MSIAKLTRAQAGAQSVRTAIAALDEAHGAVARAQRALEEVVGYQRESGQMYKLALLIAHKWRRLRMLLAKPPPKTNPCFGHLDHEPEARP